MKRRIRSLAVLGASAGISLLLVSAAGGRAQALSGSYVAKVEKTHDAFSAVVVGTKGGVLAYVCDSKQIAVWFHGRTSASRFTLSSGGYRLAVTIGGNEATGTLTFHGARHTFTAMRVKRPAGLYRAQKTVKGKHYLGGWVVRPNERQQGAIKSGSTITRSFIDPNTLKVNVSGVRITAAFIDPNSL